MVKRGCVKHPGERRKIKDESPIFFNFGWMKLIGWYSIVLFLTDFANRTGKWWFYLIALFFVITSFGAAIIKTKEKKEKING